MAFAVPFQVSGEGGQEYRTASCTFHCFDPRRGYDSLEGSRSYMRLGFFLILRVHMIFLWARFMCLCRACVCVCVCVCV